MSRIKDNIYGGYFDEMKEDRLFNETCNNNSNREIEFMWTRDTFDLLEMDMEEFYRQNRTTGEGKNLINEQF